MTGNQQRGRRSTNSGSPDALLAGFVLGPRLLSLAKMVGFKFTELWLRLQVRSVSDRIGTKWNLYGSVVCPSTKPPLRFAIHLRQIYGIPFRKGPFTTPRPLALETNGAGSPGTLFARQRPSVGDS